MPVSSILLVVLPVTRPADFEPKWQYIPWNSPLPSPALDIARIIPAIDTNEIIANELAIVPALATMVLLRGSLSCAMLSTEADDRRLCAIS